MSRPFVVSAQKFVPTLCLLKNIHLLKGNALVLWGAAMLAVADCCGGWARWCGGMVGASGARVVGLFPAAIHRVRRRCHGDSALLAARGAKTTFSAYVLGCRSRTGAKFGRRARLIHEKVIGRGMRGLSSRLMAWSPLVVTDRGARGGHRTLGMLAGRRTFALFHQPACSYDSSTHLRKGCGKLCKSLACNRGQTRFARARVRTP